MSATWIQVARDGGVRPAASAAAAMVVDDKERKFRWAAQPTVEPLPTRHRQATVTGAVSGLGAGYRR